MTSNPSCSNTGLGLLEQLEEHIKFKTSAIRGLIDLRSQEPNEKFKAVFEDVLKTFSEVDEFVDTLTAKVEREKTFVKYINSLLKANESQVSNLKKLSELINQRCTKSSEPGTDRVPETPKPTNEENERKHNTNTLKTNRNHAYKSLRGAKQPPLRGRMGLTDKSRIPLRKST